MAKETRETGEVGAKVPSGPPAIQGAMLSEWLPAHLRRNPDLTLEEHCEAFEEDFGVKVSTATMSRKISQLPGAVGRSKKSAPAQERDQEARGLWRWHAARFDARRLVFVDESGFHTSMTRLRARAPREQRAYGKVPRNLKARTKR
jgi:hypothetical protein